MRKILHLAKGWWRYFKHACQSGFSSSQNWYHLVISIATIVAGVWTYHIFISERHAQAHLSIEVGITISTNSPVSEDRRLVFLDVELTNNGRRKLQVRRVPANQIAYQDPGEVIKYGCGVAVRKIQSSLVSTNKSLNWFDDHPKFLQCPAGIPEEINLLTEYDVAAPSDPSIDGISDFWIEPTDKYHLGTALFLEKGDYLLKVHFIGNNSDDDFWSRIVYMHVY